MGQERRSPAEQARGVPYSVFRLRLERTGDPFYERRPYCLDASDAANLAYRVLHSEPHEVLGALLLDTQKRAIGHVVVARGSLDRAHFSPAGIFGPALLANAASVVLFHNHPSGCAVPSDEDVGATKRMGQAGAILGIPLRDHVILGEPPQFASLKDLRHLGDYSAVATSLEVEAGDFAKDRRRRVKPKFRDPETGETWAGRGRMANWLRSRIEAGADLEDFRISKDG